MRRISFVLAVLAAAGCTTSHGFDRGRIASELRPGQPPQVMEAEIARVLALRPQITPPFRLAIWFKPAAPRPRSSPVRWTWTSEDRESVLASSDTLRREGIASEVVVIADENVSGTDLQAIRLAAARHGADAVLVVAGAAEEDRYLNAWGSRVLERGRARVAS